MLVGMWRGCEAAEGSSAARASGQGQSVYSYSCSLLLLMLATPTHAARTPPGLPAAPPPAAATTAPPPPSRGERTGRPARPISPHISPYLPMSPYISPQDGQPDHRAVESLPGALLEPPLRARLVRLRACTEPSLGSWKAHRRFTEVSWLRAYATRVVATAVRRAWSKAPASCE